MRRSGICVEALLKPANHSPGGLLGYELPGAAALLTKNVCKQVHSECATQEAAKGQQWHRARHRCTGILLLALSPGICTSKQRIRSQSAADA